MGEKGMQEGTRGVEARIGGERPTKSRRAGVSAKRDGGEWKGGDGDGDCKAESEEGRARMMRSDG